MNRVRLTLALTALIVLGLTGSPASPAAASCTNVRGTVSFFATGPSSFAGSVGGDLEGTLIATGFRIVKTGGDETLHYAVESQEFTDRGTLSASVEGVLSPISPVTTGRTSRTSSSAGRACSREPRASCSSTRTPISSSARARGGTTVGSAPES